AHFPLPWRLPVAECLEVQEVTPHQREDRKQNDRQRRGQQRQWHPRADQQYYQQQRCEQHATENGAIDQERGEAGAGTGELVADGYVLRRLHLDVTVRECLNHWNPDSWISGRATLQGTACIIPCHGSPAGSVQAHDPARTAHAYGDLNELTSYRVEP